MEAAVALAVDLSRGSKGTRYEQICFGTFAKDPGIWDRATLAIKRLLGDEKWVFRNGPIPTRNAAFWLPYWPSVKPAAPVQNREQKKGQEKWDRNR